MSNLIRCLSVVQLHAPTLTLYSSASQHINRTYLYSLTKQDIALRDVPGMYEASRPVIHFVKRYIERVYEVDTIRIDRNQPHVLVSNWMLNHHSSYHRVYLKTCTFVYSIQKYSAEDGSKHTGVELHHDKCDLTANIMLSRSSSYVGGG